MKSETVVRMNEREAVEEKAGESTGWTQSPYRKPELEDRGRLRPKLLAGSLPPAPP